VALLIGIDVCDLIGNADEIFCCPCLFVRPSPCVFELINPTCEVNQQWGTQVTSWNRPWQNLLPLDGMSLIYSVLTQNSNFLPWLVEGTRTGH